MREEGPKHDIFVSYAREDRDRAQSLVHALEQEGWKVWWDRRISAGQRFDCVIEAALRDAECVLVVWTRRSVTSEWVINEASEARKRGILIPVLLDDVEVPLEFKRLQAANLVGSSVDPLSPGFRDLSNALAAVTSHVPLPPEQKPGVSKTEKGKVRVPGLAALRAHGKTVGLFAAVLFISVIWYAIFRPTTEHALYRRGTETGTRTDAPDRQINSAPADVNRAPERSGAKLGCLGGGMVGEGAPLPDGGVSLKNARTIAPGLYIVKRPIPESTVKYFKVRLKESETTLTVNLNGTGTVIARILDVDGRQVAFVNPAYSTASWTPPAAGWVYISLDGGAPYNPINAGDVFGICAH